MAIIKKVVSVIIAVSLMLLVSSAIAETTEIDGEVISVDIATGEVAVWCDNADVVCYFADGVVCFGRVHLLLVDGEVRDAISYAELNGILSPVSK